MTSEQLNSLINDLATDFAPMVKKIEAKSIKTTQNNYGDYLRLLGMANGDKVKGNLFALAMIKAGANTQGVGSALKICFGE
jgi:hypothetical protein